ncbi:hypothetical protein ABZ815_39315 [Nonomuraea sp. NPDC047529]|uniref:hypothetical protein n=1 Tax=Nonomuraea sp. NPDC047529 TaxID=3155623 RepID=UPI0033EF7B1F
MADEGFENPRLAVLYDPLDPDRGDLDAYLRMAEEFEARDPARRAWEEWTRESSHDVTEIPGVGSVESWVELIEVSLPLVTFRWTYVFAADGQVLTSDSTLRFREREEVERDLVAHGYVVEDVRDAPDRPGREFVFLARRS